MNEEHGRERVKGELRGESEPGSGEDWQGRSEGNMKMMQNGKAVGPGRHTSGGLEMSTREYTLEFRIRILYNRTMESERMPEERRDSVLISIVKNNDDV